MPRIRTIKPEFFQDEKLSSCTPHARLLAIALLQLCDANGVFRNIPMQVHAHAFPWEASVKVQSLIEELEGIGYVKMYRVQGKSYGLVPGFNKHQRLSGKEAQSDGMYPGICEADQDDTSENSQGSDGEALGKRPDAQEREQGKGKGTGKGNRETSVALSTDVQEIFDFWRKTTKHPRAILDDSRKKIISKALGLGYSVQDLKNAITGCTLSPHHSGMNDNGTVYDSLDLILRNGSKIDQFISYFERPPRLMGKQARTEAINQQAVDDFLSGNVPFGFDDEPPPIDAEYENESGGHHA